MDRTFFQRDTATVAEDLLGNLLIQEHEGERRGRIVETEAYYGEDDPASHASKGRTERNSPMFGQAGRAYIYICYGIHHMFNITTDQKGEPGAVLIRAVEPLDGIDTMRDRRGIDTKEQLCNGPGKLCEAFDITEQHSGTDVTGGALRIEEDSEPESIVESPRIGVSEGKERELRFYVNGSSFVS
ncbi:MAG: DNA-3-methyladenine glycosylase [Candidatus Nanohaloarchaea archaeon]|nr:DNA-3-methyladenine glycosylase [Candidatus Nanohaloarchaea archaeon]